jgi:hypothetical protein
MDLVSILLYCFMSCAIGAVLMLLVQYYAFVRYFNIPSMDESNDDEHQKRENEKYVLPDVSTLIIHYSCMRLDALLMNMFLVEFCRFANRIYC